MCPKATQTLKNKANQAVFNLNWLKKLSNSKGQTKSYKNTINNIANFMKRWFRKRMGMSKCTNWFLKTSHSKLKIAALHWCLDQHLKALQSVLLKLIQLATTTLKTPSTDYLKTSIPIPTRKTQNWASRLRFRRKRKRRDCKLILQIEIFLAHDQISHKSQYKS